MSDRSSNCEGVQNSIASLQDYEKNEDILDIERLRVYHSQTISKNILKDMGIKKKTKSTKTDVHIYNEH